MKSGCRVPVPVRVTGVSAVAGSGGGERVVAEPAGATPGTWSTPPKPPTARGWRLAEMRKRRGLTQEQAATRMGVSVARVSQVERDDVSTHDVLNRYTTALGGTLKLIADFGDEQLKIA